LDRYIYIAYSLDENVVDIVRERIIRDTFLVSVSVEAFDWIYDNCDRTTTTREHLRTVGKS
jgi:hypothetical protein